MSPAMVVDAMATATASAWQMERIVMAFSSCDSFRRTGGASKLPSQLAVERTSAATADEEIERGQQDQDRVLGASGAPEEALGRGDVDGIEHEDDDKQRGRAGEQSQHQQQPAERLGQREDDHPEQAGLVADALEDLREP